PHPGDFKTQRIGDTPVIMVRDAQGAMQVFVNRCAHRGALLCVEQRGHTKQFTCVYHNWSFDLQGRLRGVAFRHGIRNQGGLPSDFDFAAHGLQRLRVEVLHGLVFATFSPHVAPLATWLGPRMTAHFARIFHRPVRILGSYSQFMHNNWKLYMENVKDTYHASILHLFLTTFGVNRLSMEGGLDISPDGGHHVSWSKRASEQLAGTEYTQKTMHAMQDDMQLADPRIVQMWPEFEDGVTTAIQGIFPNLVVQQIQNSLALRLMIPQGVDACELHWLLFGYEDDTPEQTDIRLLQSNLVGPAGLVSMEDGMIGNWIQRTIAQDADQTAVLEMGGREVTTQGSRVSEASVRGFWQAYRTMMDV
ncbi:MAG: Rieske 2Fe-2S domain-containing protein, partial [Candidatus Tectomicrobia bacterium]|nr:Rieske 2Fe-2S domain-containing protein [Candidatus Tectomicrobia bacterium]